MTYGVPVRLDLVLHYVLRKQHCIMENIKRARLARKGKSEIEAMMYMRDLMCKQLASGDQVMGRH